jgi:CheY-like chemotaxis protein
VNSSVPAVPPTSFVPPPAEIVAITAHFLEGDREKALAAGCDDHAGKPIERDELVELCRRTMRGAEGSPRLSR